eukprot:256912_1
MADLNDNGKRVQSIDSKKGDPTKVARKGTETKDPHQKIIPKEREIRKMTTTLAINKAVLFANTNPKIYEKDITKGNSARVLHALAGAALKIFPTVDEAVLGEAIARFVNSLVPAKLSDKARLVRLLANKRANLKRRMLMGARIQLVRNKLGFIVGPDQKVPEEMKLLEKKLWDQFGRGLFGKCSILEGDVVLTLPIVSQSAAKLIRTQIETSNIKMPGSGSAPSDHFVVAEKMDPKLRINFIMKEGSSRDTEAENALFDACVKEFLDEFNDDDEFDNSGGEENPDAGSLHLNAVNDLDEDN